MKRFTCTIPAAQLEWAIDLPGWSHASQPFVRGGVECRNIYFSAKTRTEAARAIDRCMLHTRNLSAGVSA